MKFQEFQDDCDPCEYNPCQLQVSKEDREAPIKCTLIPRSMWKLLVHVLILFLPFVFPLFLLLLHLITTDLAEEMAAYHRICNLLTKHQLPGDWD